MLKNGTAIIRKKNGNIVIIGNYYLVWKIVVICSLLGPKNNLAELLPASWETDHLFFPEDP